MTTLRLAAIALLALAAAGCARRGAQGGTLAGDVYETRLLVQNLQTYTQQSHEALGSDIRALRATQEQQLNQLRARVQDLEQTLAMLNDAVERLNLTLSGQVGTTPAPRVRLALPPDPESLPPQQTQNPVTPAPPAPPTTGATPAPPPLPGLSKP